MSTTTPEQIIRRRLGTAVAAPTTIGELTTGLLGDFEEEGFVVLPATDPEAYRSEMLGALFRMGIWVAFVSPAAVGYGIGTQMYREGVPLWGAILWPAFGALAWAYVIGRLVWAIKTIANPSDRYRRKIAAAHREHEERADNERRAVEIAEARRRFQDRVALTTALIG